MNNQDLQEAIDKVYEWETEEERDIEVNPAIITLRNLAEKVLAVGKDLPEKYLHNDRERFVEDGFPGYNKAIDDCQITIAKNYWKKVSKEELSKIIDAYAPHIHVAKEVWKDDESKYRCVKNAFADAIIERLEKNNETN